MTVSIFPGGGGGGEMVAINLKLVHLEMMHQVLFHLLKIFYANLSQNKSKVNNFVSQMINVEVSQEWTSGISISETFQVM